MMRRNGSPLLCFGRLAETANQYLSKGQQVYVEGRLRSTSYEGRDGQTRYSNEITVSDIPFLSSKSNAQNHNGAEAEAALALDNLPY
jgi:single-strand DNA-binding protein